MGRNDMRAADSDRKAIADQLKAALDEGRLDLNEYDERIQKAYAAKTYGDFAGLLDDLPGTVPVHEAQVQPAQTAPVEFPARPTRSQVGHWTSPYVGVIAVCVLIWVITSVSAGHLTYFWPIWMLIPLVLGVGGQWSGHRGPRVARDARRAARDARRAALRDRRR